MSTFEELLSAKRAELVVDVEKQAKEAAVAALNVEIEAAKVVAGEAHTVAAEKQAIVDALVAQLPVEEVAEPVVEPIEAPVEPEVVTEPELAPETPEV